MLTDLPYGTYTFMTKDYGNNVAVKVYDIQSYEHTIYLDGSNDRANILYNAALAPTTAISFGIWAYAFDWTDSNAIGGALISKTETGGYNCHLDADRGTGYVGSVVRRNAAYAEVKTLYTSLSSGWHLFMTTYDGQYTKFYIDGTLKATNDAGAIYPIQYANNNSLFIGTEAFTGSSPAGVDYYKGTISDARIYDIALTEAQITTIFNDHRQNTDPDLAVFAASLKGYWRFNEGSGTNLIDYSGNGYNGTIAGTPLWIP